MLKRNIGNSADTSSGVDSNEADVDSKDNNNKGEEKLRQQSFVLNDFID